MNHDDQRHPFDADHFLDGFTAEERPGHQPRRFAFPYRSSGGPGVSGPPAHLVSELPPSLFQLRI
jgi:hypothetical protein